MDSKRIPQTACSRVPRDIVRGPYLSALMALRDGSYGDVSRITMSEPASREAGTRDAACTLGWRRADAPKRLQLRRSPDRFTLRLIDDAIMTDAMRIVVENAALPERPADPEAASEWTMTHSVHLLQVVVDAIDWSEMQEAGTAPVDVFGIAYRVGEVERIRKGHHRPMSYLLTHSPWSSAAFGEDHDDCAPLTPDAEHHLTNSIPPTVTIDHLQRRITDARDPLQIRVNSAAYGIAGISIHDSMGVMREIATWKRP